MKDIFKVLYISLFFGTVGTTIGGIIGIFLKNGSNKFLSFILSLASGLMMSIVCFDLIPEALIEGDFLVVIISIFIGIVVMIFLDTIVGKKVKFSNKSNNNLLAIGIVISIGLAIHNIPEGLAIGTSLESSLKLGISIAIAICLHDIPEGISMALPLKAGGMKAGKIILYVILSGLATVIGAFIGYSIGNISNTLITSVLGFAAGAMLYIVSGELIPESNKLYSGRTTAIGNMIGFLAGILTTRI